MGQRVGVGELAYRRSLADLIGWMNAQPRRPEARDAEWAHRAARQQLESLGLRFTQPHGPKGKIYFDVRELVRHCPLLARKYLTDHPLPPDEQYQVVEALEQH